MPVKTTRSDLQLQLERSQISCYVLSASPPRPRPQPYHPTYRHFGLLPEYGDGLVAGELDVVLVLGDARFGVAALAASDVNVRSTA